MPANGLNWTRDVTPSGRFVVRARNVSGAAMRLFVWSMPMRDSGGSGTPWQSVTSWDALGYRLETAWPRELAPDRTGVESENLCGTAAMGEPLPVRVDLEYADLAIRHWSMVAQRHDDAPEWRSSLIPNIAADPEFTCSADPEAADGFVHFLHEIALPAGDSVEIAARVAVMGAQLKPMILPSGLPAFRDTEVARAAENRLRGLQLNAIAAGLPIAGGEGRFGAFVAEGIGFFRNFVTYSAQAHLREAAWLDSPELGLDILRNLSRIQRADGSYPGHNYSSRPARDFYHAEFVTGLQRMVENHGIDPDEFRPTLRRYLDWLLRDRLIDFGGPALIAVRDQNETGQEYMSRYLFANAKADRWEEFVVGGVDATCYAYALAEWLQDPIASRLEAGITQIAYDPEARWYCDVLPNGQRSPARPATGFYPFLYLPLDRLDTGLIPIHARNYLLERGIAADSIADPRFSSVGVWNGRRLNCPWNGRSWPMASCHVVDAWYRAAETDSQLLPLAHEAFQKTISIMEWQGTPTSYEHYDPITGLPSLYRGYDDYMHSWILDLCMRHGK